MVQHVSNDHARVSGLEPDGVLVLAGSNVHLDTSVNLWFLCFNFVTLEYIFNSALLNSSIALTFGTFSTMICRNAS